MPVNRFEYLLRIETDTTVLTNRIAPGTQLRVPINHFEGSYICSSRTLAELQADDRVVLRYVSNPNGSLDDIAGICSEGRNVLGMMPHPERASEPELGGTEGFKIFESLVGAMAAK